MPIDPVKLADMRAELERRGRALEDRMVAFREKWAPAVFQVEEFDDDLLGLCEAWGRWSADFCEMVQGLDSGGGSQMAGESGSRSRGSTKRARSNQKQDRK